MSSHVSHGAMFGAVIFSLTVPLGAAAQNTYAPTAKAQEAWGQLTPGAKAVVQNVLAKYPDYCTSGSSSQMAEAVSVAVRGRAVDKSQSQAVGAEAGSYVKKFYCK